MTAAPAPFGTSPVQSDALFAELYHELHRMARREALRFGPAAGFTQRPCCNEAYMDMAQRTGLGFEDRPRFFAYAARAMRTLAIDRARERSALKRGGGLAITSLDTQTAEDCAEPETLSQIGERSTSWRLSTRSSLSSST
ncbi:MAG: ECF-type sigma factor [Pseudomonadota bacterium]|nr:ECF-type sigma factor [Pseudomonadota bacterium]